MAYDLQSSIKYEALVNCTGAIFRSPHMNYIAFMATNYSNLYANEHPKKHYSTSVHTVITEYSFFLS